MYNVIGTVYEEARRYAVPMIVLCVNLKQFFQFRYRTEFRVTKDGMRYLKLPLKSHPRSWKIARFLEDRSGSRLERKPPVFDVPVSSYSYIDVPTDALDTSLRLCIYVKDENYD